MVKPEERFERIESILTRLVERQADTEDTEEELNAFITSVHELEDEKPRR